MGRTPETVPGDVLGGCLGSRAVSEPSAAGPRPPIRIEESPDGHLLNFTDKGIQSVKDTTKRAAAAKELGKKQTASRR